MCLMELFDFVIELQSNNNLSIGVRGFHNSIINLYCFVLCSKLNNLYILVCCVQNSIIYLLLCLLYTCPLVLVCHVECILRSDRV